jgi:hypothetical protein
MRQGAAKVMVRYAAAAAGFLIISIPLAYPQFFPSREADRLITRQKLQDRQATKATLKQEIADINEQLRQIDAAAKPHETFFEDYDAASAKLRTMRQTDTLADLDRQLAREPLYLSGGVVIDNSKDLDIYLSMMGQQAERRQEALSLLSNDYDLLMNDLVKKEQFLAQMQQDEAQMGSRDVLEGEWTFSNPGNPSRITVAYDKGKGQYVGTFNYVTGLKCFRDYELVFMVTAPAPGAPNVFKGTEYGYDESCRKTRVPLILTVNGDAMTYRTKESTLTLTRIKR